MDSINHISKLENFLNFMKHTNHGLEVDILGTWFFMMRRLIEQFKLKEILIKEMNQ